MPTPNDNPIIPIDSDVEHITKTMKEINVSLVEKELPRANMSKEMYKEYFEESLENPDSITNDNGIIAKWVDFAGGVYRPVDITNEKGEVEFTVPPIMENVNIEEAGFESIDFATVIENYNVKKSRTPGEGKHFMNQFINEVAKRSNQEPVSTMKEELAKAKKVTEEPVKEKDNPDDWE